MLNSERYYTAICASVKKGNAGRNISTAKFDSRPKIGYTELTISHHSKQEQVMSFSFLVKKGNKKPDLVSG